MKLYLISRHVPTDIGPDHFVDAIFAVLISLDDTVHTTQQDRAAQAAKGVNAMKNGANTGEDLTGANQPGAIKNEYFDTEVVLGDPTGGVFAATGSYMVVQDMEYGGTSYVLPPVA